MQDAQQTMLQPNKECYRCGAELPADAEVCPKCGRRQSRVCYCGNRIPVTAAKCPYCEADWSGSARVSRKKSRSTRVKPRVLLKNAAIGAGIALLLLGMVNILIRYFARAGSGGGDVPAELFAQIDLAVAGVQGSLNRWWEHISSRSGQFLGLAIGLLIGGIVGAAGYLGKLGVLKLTKKRRTSGRRRKSQRR